VNRGQFGAKPAGIAIPASKPACRGNADARHNEASSLGMARHGVAATPPATGATTHRLPLLCRRPRHTCLLAFYDHHRCYPWQHPEPAHALRWCCQKLRALACDAHCSARGYLPDLRAKFVEFFGYDPSSRASESLIYMEGQNSPAEEIGGDGDEGDAWIGERLGDDPEHAGGGSL